MWMKKILGKFNRSLPGSVIGELRSGSRANYGAPVDPRDESGSGIEGDRRETEEDPRTQRRRRTGGANGATPVSGVPATRGAEPTNRPTSGVPARGARSGEPLSSSPLHEALRGSRSTELPRIEPRTESRTESRADSRADSRTAEPRTEVIRPRQPAFDQRDPTPGDMGQIGDFEPPTVPVGALGDATSLVDASALQASIRQTDGLYRSTKPAFAVLYGLLAAIGEILMLRPFLAGVFKLTVGTALAPLLAIIAFPFLAVGLYGLSTGAATAVQFQGPRVWLRTPLVYIPIALLLLIAAGAAA
jgi:hypothetical protein